MLEQDRTKATVGTAGHHKGRALVVIGPAARNRSEERPLAGFLAQLIACHRRLPPYRPARMADPGLAASAYGAKTGVSVVKVDRDA